MIFTIIIFSIIIYALSAIAIKEMVEEIECNIDITVNQWIRYLSLIPPITFMLMGLIIIGFIIFIFYWMCIGVINQIKEYLKK